ncbi:MAG TPA: metal ABC transporter permease [Thermoleophilaceae bacterium]|nr:metal ABC transporter permease [Thermoleophilaceae bacterium]
MDLTDLVLDPLRSGIWRRAAAEVVLLGGICGALSFWVTSFRLSYPAESLAHGLLPGLVLAALAGIPLVLGGLGGVALAAGCVALASRDPRVGADSATAVVVTGMFGLGALLALAPDAPPRLEELLFGDPLGITDTDLISALALAVLGAGALAALHRPLCAVAFDAPGAAALGVRPGAVRLALFMLLAVAVAVAVRGLGSLLVLAVLVAPAVAVRRAATRPGAAMLSGATLAAAAGLAGLYASHHLGSAAGASVALALCLAAAAGTALPWRLRPGEARARPARREAA